MGIKITTDDKPVKVHRYDNKDGKSSYAIRIVKKEGDSWVGTFQKIRFRKGVEVQDKQDICIKDAFPTVDSWVKDDKQYTKLVWQIMEFEGPRSVKKADAYNTAETELPDSFSQAEADIPF